MYIRCVDRTEVINRLKSEAVTPSTHLFLTVNFSCKNMQEVWMPVVGYEGLYQVSNLGIVKSLPKKWACGNGGFLNHEGKFLKNQLRTGYYSVRLYKEKKYTDIKIHQIVGCTFLGYVRNGLQDFVVDHIDNDKLNNRLDNLQIITQRENASKDRKNNSGFTGVYKTKNGKYRSQIKINKKQIHLGYFNTKIEAKDAYYNQLLTQINK